MSFQKLLQCIVAALNQINVGNYECRLKSLEAKTDALTNQAIDQEERITRLESSYGYCTCPPEAITVAAIVARTTNPVVSFALAGVVDVVSVSPLFYANPPLDPNDYEIAHISTYQREVISGNTYIRFQVEGDIVDATFWLKFQYEEV